MCQASSKREARGIEKEHKAWLRALKEPGLEVPPSEEAAAKFETCRELAAGASKFRKSLVPEGRGWWCTDFTAMLDGVPKTYSPCARTNPKCASFIADLVAKVQGLRAKRCRQVDRAFAMTFYREANSFRDREPLKLGWATTTRATKKACDEARVEYTQVALGGTKMSFCEEVE